MDPWLIHPTLSIRRLPRVSGDGPHIGRTFVVRDAAAPRERGWTLLLQLRLEMVGGCPA